MEMLTIKTIRDLEYYLRQLMADYYLGPAMTGKEPPGRWTGRLAADLGLAGVVDPEVLRAMWRGVGPDGQVLRRAAKFATPGQDELQQRIDQAVSDARALNPLLDGREEEQIASKVRARVRRSVIAWDWTESGVKSLTMEWAGQLAKAKEADGAGEAAGESQQRANQLTDALNETVDETIAEFERTALFTRTGHHGNGGDGAYRDGRGVVGAKFLQHTNRNGDPQLHVQTVVFNTVQRADGADDEFRAVYSSAMMRSRLGVAAIANRILARKVALLGYALVPRADGNGFEIGGVREDTMQEFSSRRPTITGELEERIAQFTEDNGRKPTRLELWAMRQDITTDTRKPKSEDDLKPGELLEQWEQRAVQAGVQPLASIPDDVARFARTHGPIAPVSNEARHRAIRIAVAEVQRQNSTWDASQLLWELHRALPMLPADVDPVQYLHDAAAEALAGAVPGANVVPLRPLADVTDISALGLRESDGRSVHDDPGTDLYCTAEHLDTEAYLLKAAARRVRPVMDEDEAAAALAGEGLSEDQAAAAKIMLSSDRAVLAFVAAAGTGKSHTVAVFSRIWERQTGARVIGLTLSTNASRVLATEGLTESHTIADFLGKVEGSDETRGHLPVRPGDVLVIDEATQVPTAEQAAIQVIADRCGARVIPVGDTEQLTSPEAGGMFGQIARDHGYVQVHEVRRFTEPWEGPASLRLRGGDQSVIADYKRHGRIREGRQDDVRATAVRLWLGDHLAGKSALLITGSNQDAADLAHDARQELIRVGRVAASGDILLADGNEASAGDLLRVRKNTKIKAGGEHLANRDTIVIDDWLTRNERRSAVARRSLKDGSWSEQFLVPDAYLRDHACLAYAGNVHVAEGLTVDTGYGLITPGMTRAQVYVAVSRGRERNTLAVVTSEPKGNQASGAGRPDPDLIREAHDDPSTAEAVLAGILDNKHEDPTATQVLRDAQDFPTSMPRLFSLWKVTTREHVFPAYDRALKARLAPGDYDRYLADPERPVLHHQLRGAQMGGHDVETVLDQATGREMDGARSIAGVLHGRIRAMNLPASDRVTTWAERTPQDIADPDYARIARDTAAAMDSQPADLGLVQAIRPSPWAVRYLGMPPRERGALRDDWIQRAGAAAAYRNMTGRGDAENALGPYPQSGAPEERQAYADAARALEMPQEEINVRSAARGELEATVQAYERVRAYEPAHVAADLEETSVTEANARATASLAGTQAAAGAAGRERERAAQRQASAEASAARLAGRREALEDADGAYEEWHERTSERRGKAAAAVAELASRGQHWTPPAREPARDDAEIAEWALKARAWAGADRETDPEPAKERPEAWHPGEREPLDDGGYGPEAEPWLQPQPQLGPQIDPPDREAGG
jgi:conjugative relaxase-like TrwC/TraI family protein